MLNMAFTLPQSVTTLRDQAQKSAGVAGQYAAAEPSVTDVLKQKVTEAYSSNQDIVKPLDEATMAYLTAPQEGREKYENIFNPFSRERLVSQYTANKALPMLSLSNIYGQRAGRIEDTLGAGVRGYQAATTAAQNQAQLQRQSYEDALSEWKMLTDLEQSQQKINQGGGEGGGVGGGSDIDMQEILQGKDLNGDGLIAGIIPVQQEQTTSQVSPPMYSPVGGYGTLAGGGKWKYGQSGWESPRLFGNNGEEYEYDSFDDPDYIEDIKKGFKIP